MLSPLKSENADETLLEDEVPFLTILREIFAYASKTEVTDFEIIEKLKRLSVRFSLKVYTTAAPRTMIRRK